MLQNRNSHKRHALEIVMRDQINFLFSFGSYFFRSAVVALL